MLMTFPMKSHEIVLGKYFSSLVFFLLALAGTLVLPIMMIVLGNPDLGRIASAYLGSLLLGGMFAGRGAFHLGSVQGPDRGLYFHPCSSISPCI